MLQGKLLSDFDPSAFMKQGLPPRIVDPALLASSRKADFVQYIQNPHYSKDAPFGQATAKIAAARNTRTRVSTAAQDRWTAHVLCLLRPSALCGHRLPAVSATPNRG